MANKYFKNVTNLGELRKQYRDLLKRFHPDNGGSEEICKEVNAEYEKLFQWLKLHGETENVKNNKEAEEKHEKEFNSFTDAALRAALQRIIHLDGINIEICGCWIWVSGNTQPVKEELKKAHFNWSPKKQVWYWGGSDEFKKTKRHGSSMEYIRNRYGSEKVETEKTYKLN